MKKGIIIIGNGFDLDLGLKTSYANFANSSQWAELMGRNIHCGNKDMLLGFLKSKYDVEKWIDIEAALLEYAQIKTNYKQFSHAHEDEEDFLSLCKYLKSYLIEQQDNFVPTKNSVASLLLPYLGRLSNASKLYTFNYTQLNVLASKFNVSMEYDATHIHGSLSDEGNVILGMETDRGVDDRYSFLYKTQNRQYRHTDILKDLKDKDEYVFFGHSLNGMDYTYFKNIFGFLTSNTFSTPNLTIITKDVNAENSFKNFLRREYISLQGLYSNTIPTFILTDEFYRQSEIEIKKVHELLGRINVL